MTGAAVHTEPAAPVATPAPRVATQLRALDGLRGLGIIVVLLYHSNLTWFPNGVLVISMFFTLSGYLLARLAAAEVDRTGTLHLPSFWRRRLRRLMPAALAVILGVSLLSWWQPSATRPLRFLDVLSGATYWENIHLFVSGSRYEEISGIASPLLHMWSLSLEEQVFVVFPLLMLALLAWRRTRAAAVPVLAAICVAGFALGPAVRDHYGAGGVSKAYYATPVRAAEFFLGVVLAVALARRRNVLPAVRRALRHRLVQLAFAVAVVAEIVVWLRVGLTTSWLFPWAMFVSAALTAAIMVAAETDALAARVLSWAPLRWLGVRVYGIYLVHWPVFRFVTLAGTGLSNFSLFWLRVAITLTISETMFRLFEDPIRRGRRWQGQRFYVGCAVLLVAALGVGWAASRDQPGSLVDTAAIALQQSTLAQIPVVGADAPTRSTIDPSLPARVLLVGDSQSYTMAGGLQRWKEGSGVDLQYDAGVGCGIGGVTPIRYLGVQLTEQPGCRAWADYRRQIVQRFRPNLVVVIGGLADLSDRRIDGGDWSHLGDPGYDAWLLREMNAFVGEVTATGATVLWFTHPDVNVPYQAGATGTPPFAENDPARMARYEQLIEQVAAQRSDVVSADLAAEVRAVPQGQFDPVVRPDGTHIDFTRTPGLVAWIIDRIRDAAH